MAGAAPNNDGLTRFDAVAYEFYWPVLVQYRHLLLSGLLVTLKLSAVAMLLGFPLATLVGIARLSRRRLVRGAFACYTEVFRNIPLVVQLFFWYFAVGLDASTASVVGLVLCTSAYLGEIIRSGIQSIPGTQFDAAYSTGLSSRDVVRHVMLPQALLIVIPPIGTELVNVIKSSALAMTITVRELTFQTQEIDALTYRGFEATTVATAAYMGLALLVVGSLNVVERLAKFQTKLL
jgi:polar amino acid transport system permease protein